MPITQTVQVVTAPKITLTPETQALLTHVRQPLLAFARLQGSVDTTSTSLAPSLMSAFEAFQAETHKPFVAFVRLLDPTLPSDREGYRNHKTYHAATYLRRVAARAEGGQPTSTRTPNPAVAPFDALARVLATLVLVVPRAQHSQLWAAIQTELHWAPARMTELQTAVHVAQPFLKTKPTALRLVA